MVYKLTPRRYQEKIKEWIRYSGSRMSPKSFVNNTLAFSVAIGFAVAFFVPQYLLFIWIAVSLGIFMLFHGFLVLAVDKRTKFVERILPDALQLMAANSRAGYIPSRALLLSARKEFGPLSEAIKTVGKEILTGESLEDSLKKMTRNIKSEMLERTVKLIIEGNKSGGQFAQLLDENASDLRRVQVIKKEINANIMLYVIFIGFAGVIGAPLLYALSSFLITTLGSFTSDISIPDSATRNVPFLKFGVVGVSPEFLFWFAIAAILLTTIFGSLIIGLISSGREKTGIKFMPLMIIIALGVFFLTRIIIAGIFGAFAAG